MVMTKKIMNKSLEFVKKSIATQGQDWPYDNDKGVAVLSLKGVLGRIFKVKTSDEEVDDFFEIDDFFKDDDDVSFPLTLINDKTIDIEMTLADDNYEDFDFFSSYNGYTDGSLDVILEKTEGILQKLANLASYPETKIATIEDLDGVQKIKITVGEFVVCQTEAEPPIAEKPWISKSLRLFIPAHFELIR